MYRLVFSIILLCCFSAWTSLSAQVFPGDADHNGRVDHLDILPIGFAYGTVGPARVEKGTAFQESAIPLAWEETFPGGLNFAHADANGNGLVEMGDLLAVFLNYGEEQPNGTPLDPLLPTPGLDPAFELSEAQLPAVIGQGALLEIPVNLGTPDLPVTLNGLAFTVESSAGYVQDVQIDFSTSWLAAGGDAFYFQELAPGDPSRLQTAQTRFGPDPVTGFGEVARLTIIIEDDLIGLLPADVDSADITIRIHSERAVDGDYAGVPIFSDSLQLTLYHPDFLLSQADPPTRTSVRVFPNPTRGAFFVETRGQWHALTVFDPLGREIRSVRVDRGGGAIQVNLAGLPSGLYHFQLYGPDGVRTGRVKLK